LVFRLTELKQNPFFLDIIYIFEMFAQLAHAVSTKECKDKTYSAPLMATYAFFTGVSFVMYHHVAKGARSSTATFAVICQCLALALLALQVASSKSAKGISAKSVMLEAGALLCRLSGTTWRHGYLPVDASGDWLYQVVDVASLVLALWLLREVLSTKRFTYDDLNDVFPVCGVSLGCFVVGMLMHANNHDHAFCDAAWMAGLLMSVVAVIPQYKLIIKSGGTVEALISHSMAAMGLARLFSGVFLWRARKHINCEFWIQDFNHAIVVILGAHLLHLVILADFAYYYIKSVSTHGLRSRLVLSESISI
jgi:hypothetical protein